MKKLKKVTLGLAILIVLSSLGCKKCYYCATRVTDFVCVAGPDTVAGTKYGITEMTNTLNYYRSRVYQCDTCCTYYNPVFDSFCGTNKDEQQVINDGSHCQPNPF